MFAQGPQDRGRDNGSQARPAPGGARPGQGSGNRPSPGGGDNNRPTPAGGRPGAGDRPGNRPSPNPGNRPSPSPSPSPGPSHPSPGRPVVGRPNPGRPNPGRPGGRPPQWGRPPQNRPAYQFRPNDRGSLLRFYQARLRYINRARRPVFAVGGFFPYGDIQYLSPLPPSLYGTLPPPPPGYQMGYFDGYVVVYDPISYLVADMIDLL